MRKECISCLCHFCDRSECRYKALKANICNIRCIEIQTIVREHYKPVLCCDRFHHVTIHKRYKVTHKARTIEEALKKMSAIDFLRYMGGGKSD